MGRHKGTPTKKYKKEEKEKIILEALKNGQNLTGRKYQISPGMICNWIKSYKENGDKVIENKYKKGNPLSKYQNKKNLTEMEKLQYENMKLRIENERLKKRIPNERRWFSCSIQEIKQKEFEIVENLSKEYSVKSLVK